MNKKDIAGLRRQLKVDNDLMKISDIFNVYIMKETTDIYHYQSQPFEMLDRDQQELFIKNFKKLITGQVDEKLFELKFKRDADNHSQLILHKGLLSKEVEDWKDQMLQMTEKMIKDNPYEKDVVITFIRAEYLKPMKKRNDEAEESERDAVYSHPFILCSINKTQEAKRELVFDYVEKAFKYNIDVDSVIDLDTPMTGFLFPAFSNGASDVNHVLYAANKANEPDYRFIDEVLNGDHTITAKEDKEVFEEVMKDVMGDQLTPSTLANVYREINTMVEENEDDEEPRLDYKNVERVLNQSGGEQVESEKVKAAFERITDNESYELKASSVVPKYKSKSIKIQTKVANISISPQDLEYVRQVNYKGKRCIMIEVEEDVDIEGFRLLPEAFGE
ncbi:DUF4317 domain-containing protein [Pseudalkalibacillus berkeleyi]|uniref:DUF4317 domain-containing protein n=1 Tax=Pseudalkalibacillus berkeleyi TaxID=1069813 RepID=A0ABS9H2R9_9BACL|nr:DUF4317 domain-containing protein [Pseudalkalibacillus berkeleyi]MCF6139179.1 DUF4317 domain-containing protein [Pseudalkalibacillus berkeleyi]